MNTDELARYLGQALPRIFTYVCAEDELPTIHRRPAALIINTEPSSSDGEHWVAVFIGRDRSSEYFDSRGLAPEPPVRRFLLRESPEGYKYNTRRLQSILTNLCGAFCIDFLVLRNHYPRLTFYRLINDFYPYRDQWCNDVIVHSRFENMFGISLNIN